MSSHNAHKSLVWGFGLLLLNLPDWKFKPTNRLTFADFYRHPEPLFSAPKKLPSPALNIVSARVSALRVPVRSVTSLHSKLPSLLSRLKCSWFLLRNLSWIFSSYQTYYSFFKILLMFHPLTNAKYIQTKKLVHISVSQFYKWIQLSRCLKSCLKICTNLKL